MLAQLKKFHSDWGLVVYIFLLTSAIVAATYISVDNFEKENLDRETQLALEQVQQAVEDELAESVTMLSILTESVRGILLHGGGIRELEEYTRGINARIREDSKYNAELSGVYGFLEIAGGIYLDTEWTPPADYAPRERPWYREAVKANGRLVEIPSYRDAQTGEPILTFARQFFDHAGRSLGVLCLDIPIKRIGEDVITVKGRGNLGFGVLFDSRFNILAHQDRDVVNESLREVGNQYEEVIKILEQEGHLYNHEFINYKNVLFMGHFKKIENGWSIAIIQPKDIFFNRTKKLAMQLGIAGAGMALVLFIVVLLSLRAKKHHAERTRALLDYTPMGAHIWDKNGKIVDCNQEALNLFGLTDKQEYIDKFYELSPEYQPDGSHSRETAVKLITRMFAEKTAHSFEWVHQKLGGEQIITEITLVRVPYANDIFVASFIRDIRTLKAATAQIAEDSIKLEETMRWYESILDSVPTAITVQDEEMRWLFLNATAEKFTGKKRTEALGLRCDECGISICGTDACAIACARRGAHRTYFTHGGKSYQVEVSILKDAEGETVGYAEVVQDVTELEQITRRQAKAEDESRAKTAFVARMSHEIRSPLNVILGLTEAQLQRKGLQDDMKEALRLIYGSCSLLNNIVNDVLDFSKIEAGKIELNPGRYDVGNMVIGVVQQNFFRLGSKPITLRIHINENVPAFLIGDELHIRQILNNILSNALKYTEKGSISFSVAAENRKRGEDAPVTIMYRVSDTGHGMTEEQLEKIFDEYTRFTSSAKYMIAGTGLGMAIVHSLVKLMDGEIQVKSKPGKGTAFTVRLPQYPSGSQVVGKKFAEAFKQFRFHGSYTEIEKLNFERTPMPYGSVLIVDDLAANIYVAESLLAPYGLAIDTALSGSEAIEKIKSGKVYDIIFMDYLMPEIDGMETTNILRSLGYTAPIVALTASAIMGGAEKFLENGFDDFVAKPIDTAQLDKILNRLIRDIKEPEAMRGTSQEAGGNVNLETNENINRESVSAKRALPPMSLPPQFAEIFAHDAAKAVRVMREVCGKLTAEGNGDIKLYTITVHGMKSALASVGEIALSEYARELELAGGEGDTAAILAKTPSFIASLEEVIEESRPQEGEEDDEADESVAEDQIYLKGELTLIQEACLQYDKKPAQSALARLREKKWRRATKDLISATERLLLHSEFAEAAELVSKYMRV